MTGADIVRFAHFSDRVIHSLCGKLSGENGAENQWLVTWLSMSLSTRTRLRTREGSSSRQAISAMGAMAHSRGNGDSCLMSCWKPGSITHCSHWWNSMRSWQKGAVLAMA